MKIISRTQSICPQCRTPVDAYYIEEQGRVILQKTCPEHGVFKSETAESADEFRAWTAIKSVNVPPKAAITKGKEGECPLHCGTCDEHLQTACCVLIDVTERCNQRCPYCFAAAGELEKEDLPLSEIERKYERLLDLGEERPFNIQISGGEPTVRDDLPEIIRMGKDKGFEYMQLNTNGKRIAEEPGYAKKLKEAGTSVVFLQFDGTNDDIYRALRNEPLLEVKRRAIENCKRAGLPVTLVPTVVRSVNLANIGEMMTFMLERLDVVKGIHFQPVSFFGRHPDEKTPEEDYDNRVTMFDVMHAICEQTGGLFRYEDMCPISAGHSLCCFCGTFLKEQEGSVRSLISEKTRSEGLSCCDAEDPLLMIKKDRDFVLNKWELPEIPEDEEEPACCCQERAAQDPMSFDEILLALKRNMFTVSGMAFQDITNLDAERLSRCRVQVFTEEDKLIPFCAYNSIYRGGK